MLVDAAGADRALFARSFDACVIGAGPAGITLARRLAAQGWSVALMEGGGIDLEPHSHPDLHHRAAGASPRRPLRRRAEGMTGINGTTAAPGSRGAAGNVTISPKPGSPDGVVTKPCLDSPPSRPSS